LEMCTSQKNIWSRAEWLPPVELVAFETNPERTAWHMYVIIRKRHAIRYERLRKLFFDKRIQSNGESNDANTFIINCRTTEGISDFNIFANCLSSSVTAGYFLADNLHSEELITVYRQVKVVETLTVLSIVMNDECCFSKLVELFLETFHVNNIAVNIVSSSVTQPRDFLLMLSDKVNYIQLTHDGFH
ncbi:hypothetical protein PFISCL1PPCAC_16942, partial [Pristionchus fissidentatus]